MPKFPLILVTGGAGFIGSHVNKMLNRAGYPTIVLDNLSTGSKETVVAGTFIEGDLSDRVLLDSLFKTYPIEAVMHFAAFIDVGESVRDPCLYYFNNVVNTLHLLNAMRQNNVKKIVFSSTAALFGSPLEIPITEEAPYAPLNPYGESKGMVEKILIDFDRAYGFRFTSLRYFNAAGGDPEGEIKFKQKKATNLIPLLLHSIKTGSPLTIYGSDYPTPDGTCIRDYIHIEDLGNAHIAALQALLNKQGSSFYNLGNGKGFSVKDVIQAAEKTLGMHIPTLVGPRRPGDSPILLADSTKALHALNWKPQFKLEEMIKHAWLALGGV